MSGPRSLKDLPVTSQQTADTRLLNSPSNRERTFERQREHAFKYGRLEENYKDAGETYLRTYAPSEICDRIGCQSCSELLSQPLVKTRLDKRFVTVPTRLKVIQNAKVEGDIRTDEVAAFKYESKFAANKTMSNCDVRNNIGVTSSTDLQKHTVRNLDRNNYSEQLTENKDKKSNICNTCGFRFIRPVDLATHLNTHESVRLTLGLKVDGFISRINAKFGQRYTVSATEAISEYERSQMKDREALNLLRHEVSLKNGEYCPKSLEDKTLISTQFRLHLGEVRPEMTGVLRHIPTTEPAIVPSPHSISPYFMKHGDPKKSFITVTSFKPTSEISKPSRRLKSVIVIPVKDKQERQKVGECMKRKSTVNKRDEEESGTKRPYKKTSSVSEGFQCGMCGKFFSQKIILQRHYVTHTGDRFYSCRICKKTFTQYGSARRHEVTQHTNK